jgi:zinc transport system permease protein
LNEFLEALTQHAFMQYALATGLLASLVCGVVGTYVVTRRITYVAGAISHCVLAGMGAARYMQVVWGWESVRPLYGAVAASLLAAIIIGQVTMRARQREDTVIGAVWAIGMAVGILFISKTPGYSQDLMSYLFGNILMVSAPELRLIAILDVTVIVFVVAFYKQFQAVCFDEEFARLRGLHVERYYILLLALTAVAVVLLVTVVGIVLVIALLTLPAAIAGHFAKKMWHTMAFATVLTVLFSTGGLVLSFPLDWPVGATTILLAGCTYVVVALVVHTVAPRFDKP